MQLMYAAEAGMTEAVKFLIECRANVNCTDKAGVTPVRLVGVLPIFPDRDVRVPCHCTIDGPQRGTDSHTVGF